MNRVFNFSPGPAALPESVLLQVRDELLDYAGRGLSVIEMSHRSDEFMDIAYRAEQSLREIYGINDDYYVLFLQGGARMQFASVALNLSESSDLATYVRSGYWSSQAITEAKNFLEVEVRNSSDGVSISAAARNVNSNSRYVHITSNETIEGVQCFDFPDTSPIPLVVDMSSDFLIRPLDIAEFGLIYGCAQKNAGLAGLTIVIVRKDLCGNARSGTPSVLDYSKQGAQDSMLNTPNTFAWYVAGLMFNWVVEQGGLRAIERNSIRRAQRIYDEIDASDFYQSTVSTCARSRMNVTFTLSDSRLDASFLEGAEAAGIRNIKGHRAVGGFRASLYIGVPDAAVDALAEFMSAFAHKHA